MVSTSESRKVGTCASKQRKIDLILSFVADILLEDSQRPTELVSSINQLQPATENALTTSEASRDEHIEFVWYL